MVLACGLTIGWTFTGYNLLYDKYPDLYPAGIQASFVPRDKCAPFSQPQNVGPWWHVFVLWNLALLIPVLGGIQVRPRDIPGSYIIAYLSLVMFGALNFARADEGGLGLNEFLINIIGLFVATNLSCFRQLVTGDSAIPSIIPVLLILAPGVSAQSYVNLHFITLLTRLLKSTVVLEVLKVMQKAGKVADVTIDTDIVAYLFLLGVSYCLGMYIALSYWKPLLVRRSVASSDLKVVELATRKEIDMMMQKKF
jgi:hypothetical protein